MKQDFSLNLPEFDEEEEIESYFGKIERAIRARSRWLVRRQLTLGMLSFGKLAIWTDLDSKKNPGILDHPLLKRLFEGGIAGDGGGLFAEDYKIDNIPEANLSIIYDADSSQHSAIIDVISGKNLVINGPPGTGKSQTITNVIAATLSQEKKVLFVSEKLAALEVVRHRLNQAGLGQFCLELHSHKTQKKRFIEDIKARLEQQFSPPVQFDPKIVSLKHHKKELARYADLIGSQIGNELGLTVNEVFWAAERRRQELGDLSSTLSMMDLPACKIWSRGEIEERRRKLEGLADLYKSIGRFDYKHPWWGFNPKNLAPTDDETIGDILKQAFDAAKTLNRLTDECDRFLGENGQTDIHTIKTMKPKLEAVPEISQKLQSSLLPKFFAPNTHMAQRSKEFLSSLESQIHKSRRFLSESSSVLEGGERIPLEAIQKNEGKGSRETFFKRPEVRPGSNQKMDRWAGCSDHLL